MAEIREIRRTSSPFTSFIRSPTYAPRTDIPVPSASPLSRVHGRHGSLHNEHSDHAFDRGDRRCKRLRRTRVVSAFTGQCLYITSSLVELN